jgi:hypothetical protein
MVTVAIIGIFINGTTAVLFKKEKERDINIKSAYLHLVADALISMGVVIAGIIIIFTDWYWMDSIISIIISIIILFGTWQILTESLLLVLDGVPKNIDINNVKNEIITVQGVQDIHHLHVWALSTTTTALTVHVVVNLDDLNIFWQSSTDIIYNFSTVPITASCPPGTDPLGPSPCDDCMASGSQIPCGDCIDCTNGTLYNGYVLDRGGYTLQGRGPGGIVNDNLTANNTWVVPSETEWNALVTYLNGGTAPANVLITGSLDVAVGGKMKDYTRDTNATCWELPNVGAQTDANNSGWSGVAGGKRDNSGVFSGLGLDGVWWSANSLPIPPASNITKLATRELKHWTDEVYRNIYTKNYGCSIRLVRPAVAG